MVIMLSSSVLYTCIFSQVGIQFNYHFIIFGNAYPYIFLVCWTCKWPYHWPYQWLLDCSAMPRMRKWSIMYLIRRLTVYNRVSYGDNEKIRSQLLTFKRFFFHLNVSLLLWLKIKLILLLFILSQNCLPLVLMFDLREEDGDADIRKFYANRHGSFSNFFFAINICHLALLSAGIILFKCQSSSKIFLFIYFAYPVPVSSFQRNFTHMFFLFSQLQQS